MQATRGPSAEGSRCSTTGRVSRAQEQSRLQDRADNEAAGAALPPRPAAPPGGGKGGSDNNVVAKVILLEE